MSDGTFRPRPPDGIILTGGSDSISDSATIVPPLPPDVVLSRAEAAERDITDKWGSLGGAPGDATVPDSSGLIAIGDGYYREYVYGRIYLSSITADPFFVHGAISDKYMQLDGPIMQLVRLADIGRTRLRRVESHALSEWRYLLVV